MLKLIVGDRNFSSWSLRPWLVLKQAGLPFDEVRIRLGESGTREEILRYSPSGKVPCLICGDTVVWDSLAICEYIAEKTPSLWPAHRKTRAEARSICAEMHSGFAALRQAMPMDVRASKPFDEASKAAAVMADIRRIVAIWEHCLARHSSTGPFLYGAFTVADAMFAPVVWRFLTYHVELPPASRRWVETMANLPAMKEWYADAQAEPVRG